MIKACKILLRSAPTSIVMTFVLSVVLMNLLANKEIAIGVPWLALDCGMLVSWLSFFSMDMITKRFGARASMLISVVATCINLAVCVVLFIASNVPGNWGAYYNYSDTNVNEILNSTIGGTWYVLLGSSVAFMVSSAVNAVVNITIGWCFKCDSFVAYAARSWGSTVLAQFVDNMVFSLMVGHAFFGWSLLQCVTCSLTGCLVELICQAVFTPAGYRITQEWQREEVGKDYLDYLEAMYGSTDHGNK